jgi:hypothetical protein
MNDELQIRIQNGNGPALIYLPGTHGDWTLNGGFRRAIGNGVRLVEFTFPRTQTWSCENYADAIVAKLAENKITTGWILAESFASQIAWALVKQNSKLFQPLGIILAGGFVRHPIIPAVRLAKFIATTIPLWVLNPILFAYVLYARIRENNSPEIRAELSEFAERRTKEDLLAAAHRLQLIAITDCRQTAQVNQIPLFYLTGLIDPIVPWPLVHPWIRSNCSSLRDFKIVWASDHHVLGAAKKSAKQILDWINAFSYLPAGE